MNLRNKADSFDPEDKGYKKFMDEVDLL